MVPHNFGYIIAIVAQQLLVVGLVWYVMQLLDRERRDRHRYNSLKLLTNVSASCDLAALATRVSQLDTGQPDRVRFSPSARIQRARRV